MSNTRNRFFTGIIFLLVAEVLTIISSTGLYSFFPDVFYVLTTIVSSCVRLLAFGFLIAGLAIMYPCSRYIRRAFYMAIIIAGIETVYIPLLFLGSIVTYFSASIEFILQILILYNCIDGIASYFDRLGDRDRFYLGGRIRSIVAFFIGLACLVSWLNLLPFDIFKTNGADKVISFSVALLEACGHGVFTYYLIRSCKRDY